MAEMKTITLNGKKYEIPGGGTSLPSGGTAGQVLTMGEEGVACWADPAGEVLEDLSEVAF